MGEGELFLIWYFFFAQNRQIFFTVCYIYDIYITVLGWTDFEHPNFSIILSQSCFFEMGLL